MKTRDVFLGVFLALLAFAGVCVLVFWLMHGREQQNHDRDRQTYDRALKMLEK